MIAIYKEYVKEFEHIAELLDLEGMNPKDIAKVFLVYITQRESNAQKSDD